MTAGDRLPDVPVTIQTGETTTLRTLHAGRSLILFFYPKNETPICTKEACAFRDAYADFLDMGIRVIGVSSDSAASHRAFATNHRLPYPLIADEDNALREALNVPRFLGFMDGRVTYVIDQDGVVRHVFNARFASDRHVEEALAAIRDLPPRATSQ